MVVPVLLLTFLRTTSAADPGRPCDVAPPTLFHFGSKLGCSLREYRGRALPCPWNQPFLGFSLGPDFQQRKTSAAMPLLEGHVFSSLEVCDFPQGFLCGWEMMAST